MGTGARCNFSRWRAPMRLLLLVCVLFRLFDGTVFYRRRDEKSNDWSCFEVILVLLILWYSLAIARIISKWKTQIPQQYGKQPNSPLH
jgi:hypothetical protein